MRKIQHSLDHDQRMGLAQCNRAQGTIKQRAFVRYLFDINNPKTFGNGTQAARKACYKGSDEVLAAMAWENLRKPKVIKLAEDAVQTILSTDEVEQEITKVARTETPVDGSMKMKALDLLTKIKAMQIQKVEQTTITDQSSVKLALTRRISKIAAKTGEPEKSVEFQLQTELSDRSDEDYSAELDASVHPEMWPSGNLLSNQQVAAITEIGDQ